MLSLFSYLALCVISGFVHLLVLIIHRLYFSLIAHIPGPRLAALTYFYQFYYDLWPYQGQFIFQYAKLHEGYGPIIRIGPDEVHVNDIAFYNEIYTNNIRRRDKSRLWFWMDNVEAFGGGATFTTIEHGRHRLRREALRSCFSRAKVSDMQGMVERKIESSRSNIMRWVGREEPLDLVNAMSALTLGIREWLPQSG